MFQLTKISIILLTTSAINFFVAVTSWRRQKNKGGFYFALGVFGLTLWTLASAFDYAAVLIPIKVLFAKLESLGYSSALIFILIFTIYYAGYEQWLEYKWVRALLWFIPISNIFLAFTNELHGWLWSKFTPSPFGNNVIIFHHGPAFIWTVITGYITMGLILLGMWPATHRGSSLAKRQARLISFAGLVPAFWNIIYLLEIDFLQGVDLTSIMFSISGLLIVTTLYGTHFLDLTPVAQDTLVHNLRDGMIVLDDQNRVLDVNQVAAAMVESKPDEMVGRKLVNCLPSICSFLEAPPSNVTKAEIELGTTDKRYFDVLISPISARGGEILG